MRAMLQQRIAVDAADTVLKTREEGGTKPAESFCAKP